MRKKIWSVILTLAMVLSLMPTAAWAAEGDAYAALAAAIKKAPTDGTQTTVTLTGNIIGMTTDQIITVQKGQNIVLDMAGHSITVADGFAGRPIVNEGTLTVTGNGTIDASASEGGFGAINNKNTLTIENGTYRGAVYASGSGIRNTGATAVLVIEDGVFEEATCAVYNEGTATIKNGRFSNHSCSACAKADGHEDIYSYVIRNATADSKMTIDGGTFTGTQGAASAAIGSLTVNGGSFKTVDCSEKHGAIFYALYAAGEVGKVETVINGGTFETEGKITAVLIGNDNTNGDGGINAQAAAEIRGGTFKAPQDVPAVKRATETGQLSITGGTFSSDVSAYMDLSSNVTEDTNGNFVIIPNKEEDCVAEINGKYYKSLSDAITSAKDGDTVTLLKDCGVGTNHIIITDGRSLTIDMNGKNINIENHILAVKHGAMTFTGKGEIKAPSKEAFNVLGNQDPATWENTAIDAVLTIGPDVTVTSGIAPVYFAGKGAVANIYGTLVATGNAAAVQGNGIVNANMNKGGTVVNIYDGAVLTAPKSLGIYQPQSGTVNVYGGTITGGVTGIEMRAGVLNISGGTIAGGTEQPYSQPNGNGSTTWNAAVAVAQHTTKLPIEINITGGTFTGGAAIYESDPNGVYTDDGSVKKPDVTVTGGDFDGTICSQNCTGFISGGHFSNAEVDNRYLDAGCKVDGNGYVVPADNSVASIGSKGYASLEAAIEAAQPGDTVTLLQNVTLDGTGKGNNEGLLTINKNITLNGNGKTLTADNITVTDGKGPSMVNVESPATVTIKDLIVDGGNQAKHGLNIYKADTVTLENVTVKNNRWYAVVNNSSDVTVNGLITSGNQWGVNVDSKDGNASLTVNDANISESSSIVLETSGSTSDAPATEINGGSFQHIVAGESGDSANLTISGGKFATDAGPNGSVNVADHLAPGLAVDGNGNVYTPSTGGGSYEPSGDYVVSVDKTVGGKVTVNPGRADKGDTVTITVKPDKGYELDSLIVTAKDGGAVKLTEKSANKFTFKMPGSKVTVEAVFVKEETKPVVTLPFADVNKGDWYYDAVEYVYENDLMNGTSATTFSPFVTTSRAMILTILARYDGMDTTAGSTWYEAGAVWAVSKGISDGTNLEADLTREQLVTMLWRYAGSPVVESGLSAYPDGAAVSDWAVNAMIWATNEGVITGNGAGALNPQGTATRAEVATILARFCAMEG